VTITELKRKKMGQKKPGMGIIVIISFISVLLNDYDEGII